MTAERIARAALSAALGPSDHDIAGLVAEHGAVAVLDALRQRDTPLAQRAKLANGEQILQRGTDHGVRFIIPSDDEWPEQLGDLDACEPIFSITGAPVGLWVKGPHRLDRIVERSVAIVGARASTRYGERIAADLAAGLSENPSYAVVSGGAYGIDASAHAGAVVSGATIGVYACGLDSPYPRGNARLFDRLASEHLVISEHPVGVHPTRLGFLSRNRLIACLSQGTIVVEAAQRSGARNTATWAGELGRVVMAVPGPVHSASSIGCHRLIRDGRATLVGDVADVRSLIEPLSSAPEAPVGGEPRALESLEPRLLRIREAMPGGRVTNAGELAATTGEPIQHICAALTELELLGWVKHAEDGWRLTGSPRFGSI